MIMGFNFPSYLVNRSWIQRALAILRTITLGRGLFDSFWKTRGHILKKVGIVENEDTDRDDLCIQERELSEIYRAICHRWILYE